MISIDVTQKKNLPTNIASSCPKISRHKFSRGPHKCMYENIRLRIIIVIIMMMIITTTTIRVIIKTMHVIGE